MTDSAEGIVLASADKRDVTVALTRAVRPFGDEVIDVGVTARGPDLLATVWVRTLDGDGLPHFLEDLTRDFRGWAGVRHWRSFEGSLAVRAEHAGRRIRLQVELTATDADGAWRVTVPLEVEPGEGLAALARGVAALLW
ncbi:DUF6228 family protein [Geodermatophilus pulveris]|uniref:DUF6228 family protein n=1 Tax=Geodermatophilus pulveris TaxID=1564159 RepID=UPI000B78D7AE|nr:DUF6228 family protein [Geodermatophilus pulveris]